MITSEGGFFRRPRHPILLTLTIVTVPALWVVFVATGNPHELMVGGVASIASIVFTLFVCRSSATSLELRPQDLIQVWRIPWYIIAGIVLITVVWFNDQFGLSRAKSLYRVCGFDTSSHDPVREARTVLAVVYTGCTPNFIVIGVDPAQSRMLFHQIEAGTIPRMTKALGAKS